MSDAGKDGIVNNKLVNITKLIDKPKENNDGNIENKMIKKKKI